MRGCSPQVMAQPAVMLDARMGAPGATMANAVWIEDLFANRPGRAVQAARIAAACAIVTVLSMALGVPEVPLSCYLVFFAAKDGQAETVATALKLIVAATVGVALGFVFIMLTAGEPGLRILAMAFFMVGGLYFAAASRLGPEAAVAAFVFSFVLTLFDLVPIPELVTRAILWLWVITALPMGCLSRARWWQANARRGWPPERSPAGCEPPRCCLPETRERAPPHSVCSRRGTGSVSSACSWGRCWSRSLLP